MMRSIFAKLVFAFMVVLIPLFSGIGSTSRIRMTKVENVR
ncbi:hypothetical protein J2Z66_006342 [Paenibacillus eucommiae]|uniref:Uncharacterized protein n=1 Tax=Paenibacillus eucommiae TaxID=1355755 RepID=A0ABS4J4D7_9BACL|nr:hypothetical protein [Paenibacillus eucommiae]